MFSMAVQAEDNVQNMPPEQLGHSPRDAVKDILAALSADSGMRISDVFDTVSPGNITRQNLNAVIQAFPRLLNNNGTLLPQGIISAKPEGIKESGVADDFEKVGEITIDGKVIPILLQRLPRLGGKRWLISQRTAMELIEVSTLLPDSFIDANTPEFLKGRTWRGAPIAHWFSVPFLVLISIFFFWLAQYYLNKLHASLSEKTLELKSVAVFSALIIPGSLLLAVSLFVWLERSLGISIVIRQDMGGLTISVIWVASFIAIWSLVDRVSSHGEQALRDKNRVAGISIVLFFRAIARVTLIIVAVILILDSYGVDVTTGLAALGIGGIAIALGAQKAIENIVGSIILVIDQPFRVGDLCRIGQVTGTIENIGLRSTRIRTLNDTMVTFPNGELSADRIENFTLRRKFLLRTTLNLRYETKSEDLQNIVQLLKECLEESEWVLPEPIRVRFRAYGASSKDVEVLAYIEAEDLSQFLERQEPLLYKFGEIVEQNGSGFAFPSQTLYMAKD